MRLLLALPFGVILATYFGYWVSRLRGGSRYKLHIPIIGYFIGQYDDPRVFEGELSGFSLCFLLALPGTSWLFTMVMVAWGICTLFDCAYRSIVPAIVVGMFALSLFIHGAAMLPVSVLVNVLMFAIYSMVYALQLARDPVNTKNFEVRGFGLADMFLLCTLVNSTSLAVVASSIIMGVLAHTPCRMLAVYHGVADYESKSFAFYPFTMIGMAVTVFFQYAMF